MFGRKQIFRDFPMHVVPIKGITNFSNAVRYGKRFSTSRCMITVHYSDEPQDIIHYGIIVRKKIARTSVMRNRIKRLLRESIRLWASELTEETLFLTSVMMTWNAIPKHPMLIDLSDVQPDITRLLTEAIAYNVIRREKRSNNKEQHI